MENRIGLVTFFVLVLLFAFSFVFCLDALAIPNTTYGVLALIGYIFCIVVALFQGMTAHKEGSALSVWYYGYTIVVSIVFVWYLTRCGTAFKFW
jgi:hypothetical protein